MKKIIASVLPIMMFASTITFEKALDEAWNNNDELKAKKLNIELAKQNFLSAKSQDWGRLFFTEEIGKTNNALYVFGDKLKQRIATFRDFGMADQQKGLDYAPGDLNYPDPKTNYNTKISYDVPIFTGFKLKYAKEIAKLQIKANEFKFNRDKNKLAIEVLKAYNGVVAAKYFINALESAKETTTSFVKMTKDLYSQGMVVKSDVLSAKARDSEVDAKLLEAKNKYKLALLYLQFLTGDNTITDVKDFKVIISPNNDLKQLQAQAIQNRNDIKWMNKNVESMNKQIKMNESIKYPTIGAHLEYGQNNDKLILNRNKDYYYLAANITYNFINPGEKQELEKSKIQSHQTALYYSHMKKGIKLDVAQKLNNLQTKTAIIKTKLKHQQLAHSILEQYKDMYRNGLINITILLMKQSESQRADAEVIKAKYDQTIAAAELKLAVGTPIK